ncbi:heat-shock protein Hsp20 [Hylemonella gracilis str. Niagara R]|uniref:Heat-shock protein Hsp20 n=1 Tax=Hylemonella gracilis str. Niagara R TaxID=1458275 RepID=A0A016XJS1_9BURK|nr:Hsp20/alpha crystallin family protein [Hylemonella gracilis]EYC52056.1 heat-shock protein Hsp20 [Hylemonella gracilis str. Niagara R]
MLFVPALRRSTFVPSLRVFDRTLDRVFDNAARSRYFEDTAEGKQDDKFIELTFDVPGVAREQLSIGIEGNVVRIETLAEAKRQYKAAYELAQDIDASASEAKLEHGVLTLKLAKVQPQDRSVKLTIN